MEFVNLLALSFFNETHGISLDFIGKFIQWLVKIGGSVGIGIILFSLALKLVTLPFDIMQRISMRKQNNQMKKNQAQMEKLQKQYANDKEKYNQKVMEMYKENGLSLFSSCLPMILSMVIFFVAIGAFNSYAAYSNVENYNSLVKAYNTSISSHGLKAEEIESYDQIQVSQKEGVITYTVQGKDADDFVYFTSTYTLKEGESSAQFIGEGKFESIKNYLLDADKNYFVNMEKASANESVKAEAEKILEGKITAKKDEIKNAEENQEKTPEQLEELYNAQLTEKVLSDMKVQAYEQYFSTKAQAAVKTAYDAQVKNETNFLWIKNIWVTDASYKHPIMGYTDFSNEIIERGACGCSGNKKVTGIPAYTEEGYKHITAQLDGEKSAANGYFVLIALSIGTILLQQFVSMRAQKEQQKYSSVDGQGASQQKMTMIIMTGMFAIFSFMYSSAFSIYLVVSNLFSMLSMFVINKCVDLKEKKKKDEKEVFENNRAARKIEEAKAAGRKSAQKTREEKDGQNGKSAQNKNKKK